MSKINSIKIINSGKISKEIKKIINSFEKFEKVNGLLFSFNNIEKKIKYYCDSENFSVPDLLNSITIFVGGDCRYFDNGGKYYLIGEEKIIEEIEIGNNLIIRKVEINYNQNTYFDGLVKLENVELMDRNKVFIKGSKTYLSGDFPLKENKFIKIKNSCLSSKKCDYIFDLNQDVIDFNDFLKKIKEDFKEPNENWPNFSLQRFNLDIERFILCNNIKNKFSKINPNINTKISQCPKNKFYPYSKKVEKILSNLSNKESINEDECKMILELTDKTYSSSKNINVVSTTKYVEGESPNFHVFSENFCYNDLFENYYYFTIKPGDNVVKCDMEKIILFKKGKVKFISKIEFPHFNITKIDIDEPEDPELELRVNSKENLLKKIYDNDWGFFVLSLTEIKPVKFYYNINSENREIYKKMVNFDKIYISDLIYLKDNVNTDIFQKYILEQVVIYPVTPQKIIEYYNNNPSRKLKDFLLGL